MHLTLFDDRKFKVAVRRRARNAVPARVRWIMPFDTYLHARFVPLHSECSIDPDHSLSI